VRYSLLTAFSYCAFVRNFVNNSVPSSKSPAINKEFFQRTEGNIPKGFAPTRIKLE